MNKTKTLWAFDKNDSLCLKGFAIILLMCIHCFGSAERFAGYEFNFWLIPEDIYIKLAYYCKICVSVFAFISGYGLYLSAKTKSHSIKETNKWYVSRIIKTLSGFWFLYPLSFFCGAPVTKYLSEGVVKGCLYALLDFLGISHLFGTPTLNASWWYISAALVFIIFVPFLVRATEKIGWFSVLAVIVFVPRILFNNKFFGAMNIYTFLLPVYFGAMFAEFKVFEKIEDFQIAKNKLLNEILTLFGGILIILASIYIWIKVPYSVLWEYHFGIAPVLVIVFCDRFIFKKRGPISKGLCALFSFLGKHSMNIFIFHSFIRLYLLKDFIYSLKYPTLTIFVLLIISLAVSLVVELIKKLVKFEKAINFIEKKLTL